MKKMLGFLVKGFFLVLVKWFSIAYLNESLD